MGATIVDVSVSVLPGRLCVAEKQSVDCERHHYRRLCLDLAAGFAFADYLSPREVAHCSEWRNAGDSVYPVCVCRDCQFAFPNALGKHDQLVRTHVEHNSWSVWYFRSR